MNSMLKIGLPIILFVVLIFGLTLISQNVGDETPQVNTTDNKISGPPLRFAYTNIGFNPVSEVLEERSFSAFHEQGSTVLVSFWFTNPHPVPVTVEGLGRGCPACSQARIGYVEETPINQFAQWAAVGSIPTNPFP
jgi:hypothetical protein